MIQCPGIPIENQSLDPDDQFCSNGQDSWVFGQWLGAVVPLQPRYSCYLSCYAEQAMVGCCIAPDSIYVAFPKFSTGE